MPETRYVVRKDSPFRIEVRRKPCPKCHAAANQECIRDGVSSLSNHQERVDLTTKGDTSYWRRQRTRK